MSEQNTRDRSSLFDSGLDSLSVGFAIFDASTRLVGCNKAFGALRGYPDSLCKPGTQLADFYRHNAKRGDYGPGEIEEQVRLHVDEAFSGHPRSVEYVLPGGKTLIVEYTPIAPDGLLLCYTDTTQRKHAELALRKSEERYALAMAGERLPSRRSGRGSIRSWT